MRGKVSGRVAKVERLDQVTVLTLVGEHEAGRAPHITSVRFPGRSAQQVADVEMGDAVICDAQLVYRQWRTGQNEARSENTAVGLTCYLLSGGSVISTHGYLALQGAVCHYDLVAYVVRAEHDQADHCRVRVWTKDDQGERHFYSVTFTGARAATARSAQPGMIMHLNVTARKVKLGHHWTDLVEARHVHLCMSRVHKAGAQPVPDERPAPLPTPSPMAADAPIRMPRPKLAPRLTTGGVGGEWLEEAAD